MTYGPQSSGSRRKQKKSSFLTSSYNGLGIQPLVYEINIDDIGLRLLTVNQLTMLLQVRVQDPCLNMVLLQRRKMVLEGILTGSS